jgi:hypothetical protein
MSNDNLHPVFGEYFDNLLNKPSAPAAPAEDPAPAICGPGDDAEPVITSDAAR